MNAPIATNHTILGGEAAGCGKQVNAVAYGSILKAANLDRHVIQPKKPQDIAGK